MFSRHIAYRLVFALTGVLVLFGSISAVAWADPCPDPDSTEYKTCRQWWLEQRKQCSSVTIYSVQSGDTLWSIAARFDLDVDTLRYSNPAIKRNPDVLAVGQQIRVLPFIGAIHQVKKGDTLTSIARRWNVTPETITAYSANYIHNGQVQPGQELVIPGGYLALNIPPTCCFSLGQICLAPAWVAHPALFRSASRCRCCHIVWSHCICRR